MNTTDTAQPPVEPHDDDGLNSAANQPDVTYPTIFMQWWGDYTPDCTDTKLPDDGNVTWCRDRINESDVVYVPAAELARLRQDVFQTYSWEQGSMLPVTEWGDWIKANDYRRTVAENERLREQLAAVTAERDRWELIADERSAYRDSLRLASGCPDGTALAEWVGRLREDARRLDWLGLNLTKISRGPTAFLSKCKEPYCWEDHPTLRAAIDHLMPQPPTSAPTAAQGGGA